MADRNSLRDAVKARVMIDKAPKGHKLITLPPDSLDPSYDKASKQSRTWSIIGLVAIAVAIVVLVLFQK